MARNIRRTDPRTQKHHIICICGFCPGLPRYIWLLLCVSEHIIICSPPLLKVDSEHPPLCWSPSPRGAPLCSQRCPELCANALHIAWCPYNEEMVDRLESEEHPLLHHEFDQTIMHFENLNIKVNHSFGHAGLKKMVVAVQVLMLSCDDNAILQC